MHIMDDISPLLEFDFYKNRRFQSNFQHTSSKNGQRDKIERGYGLENMNHIGLIKSVIIHVSAIMTLAPCQQIC